MKYRLLSAVGILLLVGCERRDPKKIPTVIPGVSSAPAQTPHRYIIAIGGPNMAGAGMRGDPYPAGPIAMGGSQLGPAYAFGRSYSYDQGVIVEIFNCAVGGTSLADWAPNGTYHSSCWNTWRASGGPTISAILYMGGELEGIHGDIRAAENWGQTFTSYAQQWRNSFNNSNMPVVVCALGPNPGGDHEGGNGVYTAWKTVQDAQGDLFFPKVGVVTSKDLSLSDGWIYFDKQSYSIIGERMYRKYSELAGDRI